MALRRLYKCEWNIGDVFAWRMESELAKEKGLFGKYLLIQKVDEDTWYPGHTIPIVYVKITADEQLPQNYEEYCQLEYVQTSFTNFENRFWPLDGRRVREDIEEKSRLTYEVDEYGFLPEFRISLITTSKKMIPPGLQYVGNYPKIIPPKKEFIPHVKINIRSVAWKRFDMTFESCMINSYCNHNLRQLSVYQQEHIADCNDNGTGFLEIAIDILESHKKQNSSTGDGSLS